MENKIILATGHAHAFHRASCLAAIINGYFREEGLPEVELGATGEDTLTVSRLKSGDIHFGLDVRPGFVLEENSRGEKMYIIAGMLNYLDKTFIGGPGIKSIADLKGKKIGVIEKGNGRDYFYMRLMVRRAGLDPDRDVEWVPDAGYGALSIQAPRLDRGDFQGAGLSGHNKRPELFELIRQAGYNLLAERSQTHPQGLPDRAVVVMGDTLEKHPQMVHGVLKAVVRGYRFGRDPKNAEKIKEIYLKYNWGKAGYGWGKFDESLLDGMVRSTGILPADGGISQTGLEEMIDEYKAWGKIPETYAKEEVLRLEPLKQAVRELDAKFGPEGYE